MCLISQRREPLIAKEDLKVYKMLLRDTINCKYITPFQGMEVNIGEVLYGGEMSETINAVNDKFEIGQGYIHGFIRLSKTDYLRLLFYCIGVLQSGKSSDALMPLFIFEAIIPKGTEYYISEDFNEICAKKMIIQDKSYMFDEIELIDTDDILTRLHEEIMEENYI